MCGAPIARNAEVKRSKLRDRVVACPACDGALKDAVPWGKGQRLQAATRTGVGVTIVVSGERHEFHLKRAATCPLALRLMFVLANESADRLLSWERTGGDTSESSDPPERLVRRLSLYLGAVMPTTMEEAVRAFRKEAATGSAVRSKYAGTCPCGGLFDRGEPMRFHVQLGVVACRSCETGLALEIASRSSQQLIDGVRVPAGYEVWNDGVFRLDFKKEDQSEASGVEYTPPPINAHELRVPGERLRLLRLIAPRAIWITGLSVPLDDQIGQQLRLVFFDDGGRRCVRSVPRGLIARTNTLVDLASHGYAVHDLNVKGLLLYLASWLEENGAELPAPLLVRRYGAFEYAGKIAWRIGDRTIGPKDVAVDVVAPEANRYTEMLAHRGSKESWLNIAKEYYAKPHPLVRLALGAAVAPPLLRLLGQRSFCAHVWGNTESSKTAVWAFAMSVWGNQQLLVQTLNRTQISATEMFREMTDLPVVLDEKELVDTHKGIDFRRLVYEITSEQGRGRARDKGGLEWQPTWKTVLLTTGEDPVAGTSQRQDLGGMANRLLEIQVNEPILERADGARLHTLTDYGWAGPDFIERLNDYANGPGEEARELKLGFERFRKELVDRVQREETAVTQAAIIGFAEYLFACWNMNLERQAARGKALDDAVWVLEAVARSTTEDRRPVLERAVEVLCEYEVSNPDRFAAPEEYADWLSPHDKDDPRPRNIRTPLAALIVEEKDEMWWTPREFERILREAGLSPKRVLADFKTQGLLNLEQSDHNRARREHRMISGGKRKSYYVTPIGRLHAETVVRSGLPIL
jgi:hypothetical protein